MTDNTTFTPQEFQARLKDSRAAITTFLPPLTAFIRESEQGEDYLQVTVQSCQSWIEVPTSLIDSIEHLRDGRCGDHSHPVVLLNFKPIQNPETRAILALIAHTTRATIDQRAGEQQVGNQRGSAASEPAGRGPSNNPDGAVSAARSGAWWCVLPDFMLTSCQVCINECQHLNNPTQRINCIKNCCC